MSDLDLDAIERRANKQRATDEDLIDMVAEVRRLQSALDAIGKERNDWARKLADAKDERDTARKQLDELRGTRDENLQTIYRIEALLYDWEQLGRAAGVHGRQLRRALYPEETIP